jgi:hypothetical protein
MSVLNLKLIVKTIGLGFLMASQSAMALQSGDKIVCFDDVSSYKYQIKVLDIGDEEGYVRVTHGKKLIKFYDRDNVAIEGHMSGTSIIMLEDGRDVAAIHLESTPGTEDLADSYYEDGGDSRGVDCKFEK